MERPAVDPRCAVLLPVVAAAQAGTVDLVISTVTATELLTGPLRAGNREAEAAVRLFMGLLCTVLPVDLAVAERAAALRAEHGLRTPDALVCATALCSAAVVVGNDLQWKQIGSGVRYVHIDDVVAATGHG
ncbi:MAG: PIN domain-containing protein [Pseudonocardiales bacterium]|nr:PIN domain-containing protein [Pseudonocardiales bacterium]